MPDNNKALRRWIRNILATCLILLVGWLGKELWGEQKDLRRNYESLARETYPGFLVETAKKGSTVQQHIINIENTLGRIEDAMIEESYRNKRQDSILQSLAIKVDFLYNGR